MGHTLDAAFEKVASETGITLVDAFTPSLDHTVCAPEHTRWVEGSKPDSPAFNYHPNAAGMAATADLIVHALAVSR
jgi:hypothetical protein